jgi:hypothetical protein
MSRAQGLQAWPTPAHAEVEWVDDVEPTCSSPALLSRRKPPPVLIRIPAIIVSRAVRPARRPSDAALGRVRSMTQPSAARSQVRRRRLRREIRWMGRVLLVAAPLTFAAVLLHSVPQAAPSNARSERTGPAVSLSIEPGGLSPRVVREPAVVFPEYLLPVHSAEDSAHAGG